MPNGYSGLHPCGLLRASVRPGRDIAALRVYLRLRERHLDYAQAHILHMQKALTFMNLQPQLVGFAMSERLTKQLVCQALIRAVSSERPAKGVMHHSDRGQSVLYTRLPKAAQAVGMQSSMSRKGHCWDTPMESFWGVLKNEFLHHRRYATREEGKQEITEYIEIFHNQQRKQAHLGYLWPAVLCETSRGINPLASTIDDRSQSTVPRPQPLKV
jgi:hypothetical protein